MIESHTMQGPFVFILQIVYKFQVKSDIDTNLSLFSFFAGHLFTILSTTLFLFKRAKDFITCVLLNLFCRLKCMSSQLHLGIWNRIDNGNENGEYVKETTTRPKIRKLPKAINGSSPQWENFAPEYCFSWPLKDKSLLIQC